MTAPGNETSNVASGSASVGVQAGVVHNVTLYQVPPDATPEQRFELGRRFLQGGMPGRARECISEAIALGHVTSRSCFYFLLALLSGRTVQQISHSDVEKLAALPSQIRGFARDEWTDGIRAVMRVIDSLRLPGADPDVLTKELEALGKKQRDEISRHLEIFLRGPLQDWLWNQVIERARKAQRADDRTDRVWKFFQPVPAKARVRPARTIETSRVREARCLMAAALAAVLGGYVVWVAAREDWPTAMWAVPLSVGACIVCAIVGADWRYRVVRLRAKDSVLRPSRRWASQGRSGGYAKRIDSLFDRYFGRYVPLGVGHDEWLAETAGHRRALRDELVEIYREQRTDATKVAWLVRYLVSDVKRRWQTGTLWAYRDELRMPLRRRTLFALAATAGAVGIGRLVVEAIGARPVNAAIATVFGLLAAWSATHDRLSIVIERRRFADDTAEADRKMRDRVAAYDRWCRKLADKPTDTEMAAWLDSDRKVLTDVMMRHYRLQPQSIITQAFIEAPARGCKRARVWNGPLRYSRYRLLVFLLTLDGVRQLSVKLDFERASFHDRERLNYRFDAVAAVQVVESDDSHHKTFELTLVSNYSINAEVTSSTTDVVGEGEDPDDVSETTLDAAGLDNTLHVLEGIAAEGKQWIPHEGQRAKGRLATLADALHGIIDDPHLRKVGDPVVGKPR